MAITSYQTPAAYTPNYNPQRFRATSNQIGVADFMYRVICTDILTGESQTYNIKQRPTTGDLWFDAKVFTDNFIKNYIPNNVYGFKVCTDAVRKIRVNVGEYYSAAYTAGSNYDYIIWNGVARPLDWVYYAQADYVYTNTVPFKYLSSGIAESGYRLDRGYTFADTSLYLYTLADVSNTVEKLRIKTYDVNGTLLGTSDIANIFYNDALYQNKYFCIDIGYKGLTNIPSAQVTGTYPIMTASVSYYIIYDVETSAGSPPSGYVEPIRRVDVKCEPRFTIYTLQYLAKGGNFETLHFNKMSEFTESSDKTFYRVNPNQISGTTWSYGKDAQWQKVLSSTGQESLTLNTDWLTEDQFSSHRGLFTSPVVYLDYGSTTGLVPVIVKTPSILVNKGFNKKNDGMTIVVEPTYKNTYQHD